MSDRKERHTCESCLHDEVCELAVYKQEIICDDYIDKKDYKRPVGEWNTHHVAFHLTCPFCGCNIRALKDKVFEGDYNYNYCPNCGAYMKGVNAHE